MKTSLLTKWLHVLLYATMNVAISTHKDLWKPGAAPSPRHHTAHTSVSVKLQRPDKLSWTPRISGIHDYLYQFRGRAMYQGLPVARASVMLRVTTHRDSIARGTITDADGNYSIEMMVCGKNTEAVQWSLRAYTPESQRVELEGSRIILQEDERVVVQNGLDLLPS